MYYGPPIHKKFLFDYIRKKALKSKCYVQRIYIPIADGFSYRIHRSCIFNFLAKKGIRYIVVEHSRLENSYLFQILFAA